MRATTYQFEIMVSYMEEHGDLSRVTSEPSDRLSNLNKWEELTAMLNSDVGGDSRNSLKWKKVWSDFKNNTNKKLRRIQALGPESKLKLTELELRVLRIRGIVIVTDDTETLKDLGSSSHDEDTTETRPKKCRRESTVYRLQSDDHDQENEKPEKKPKQYHRDSTVYEIPSADHNYHTDLPKPITDEYWRLFKVQQHKDNMRMKKEQLRIREMEVQAQLGWQELGNRAVDLLDKLVVKYCNNKK